MLEVRKIIIGCCWLAAAGWSNWADAQLPKAAESRLGLDLVLTQAGEQLYGFLLDESPQAVALAVEKAWLQRTYPALFTKFEVDSSDKQQQARTLIIQRSEDWMAERATDEPLINFLTAEIARLKEPSEGSQDNTRFLKVQLERSSIREVRRQPHDRRHVAGIAYMHNLENIVATPTNMLRSSLEKLGVDVLSEQVDLSGELAQSADTSVRAWASKMALIEYQLRKPLEYHGIGDQLVRKQEQVDLYALIQEAVGGLGSIAQLGAELGLPEFKNLRPDDRWWHTAVAEAERDGFRGVLLTRVKQHTLAESVTVEAHFFAIQSPGNWFEVVKFTGESRANEQSEERLARLREDPQVQQILATLKSLGIDAEDRITLALRQGAATEQALQRAHSQFLLYLGKQIRSLD